MDSSIPRAPCNLMLFVMLIGQGVLMINAPLKALLYFLVIALCLGLLKSKFLFPDQALKPSIGP
jgi:hypothetical protein